jgi:hypothetical protein
MMTLSPQEQALQQQLFGGAGQFYQQAQAPIAQTEQDIYNRLYAVAAPQRERERLMTEERLAAQGRLWNVLSGVWWRYTGTASISSSTRRADESDVAVGSTASVIGATTVC